MTKQEKGQIKSTEAETPNVGLGQLLYVYDSSHEDKPIKTTMALGCSIILLLGCIILPIYIAIDIQAPEALLGILFSVCFLLLIQRCVKILRDERVYVYNEGFLWQTINHKGVIKRQDKVDFKEVSGIACPKTRAYQNGRYNHTSFKLSVFSKDGSLMTEIKGVYFAENENKEDAIHAIMERWFEFGWKLISKEIHTNGKAQFVDPKSKKAIIVSDKYIQQGENIIYRDDNFRYGFNNGVLIIRAEKRCDIEINVNRLINNELFLYTISSLLGIK